MRAPICEKFSPGKVRLGLLEVESIDESFIYNNFTQERKGISFYSCEMWHHNGTNWIVFSKWGLRAHCSQKNATKKAVQPAKVIIATYQFKINLFNYSHLASFLVVISSRHAKHLFVTNLFQKRPGTTRLCLIVHTYYADYASNDIKPNR